MSQNVIELNGKRYDAITGAYLGKSTAKTVLHAQQKMQGKVIDGFIRQSVRPTLHTVPITPVKQATKKKLPISAAAAKKEKEAVPTAVIATPKQRAEHKHTTGVSVAHHRPEHAKTLMRHTVQKPEMNLKPAIKTQAPAEIAAKPASAIARKPSATRVDPTRLERAKHAIKHVAVRRFPSEKKGIESIDYTSTVALKHVPIIPVRAHPVAVERATPVTAKRPDMFEAAIKHAKSHEEPLHKRRRAHRRLVNTVAIVSTFLILGGFVTYLNLPNIQLHIASVQAGFHATIPDYTPTGYALQGGVNHTGGTISMRFTSGDSSYQVTEQSSNWNSQTLLDNTLALSGQHETIERGGRTIYIYANGANASWVTGSVRYDITGTASLSPDELANIASSM
ncbi:MAG TPA: hypothetical protein VLH38_01505 [Patescibacteria group bacterium]|nr:hypothetical protein [Patescibacteria group bacterium]